MDTKIDGTLNLQTHTVCLIFEILGLQSLNIVHASSNGSDQPAHAQAGLGHRCSHMGRLVCEG